MIVSTALLCVCLSVRQQWFGSLLYVAVIPPVDAQHHPCPSSQPHLTELSHLSCISSSLLFPSNTVSHVRRQQHGALLTASDRFPQQFPPPLSLPKHSPQTGSGIPVLRRCCLVFSRALCPFIQTLVR